MFSFFLFSSLSGGRGAFGFPAAFRRRWFRIIGHRLRPATTTTTTTTTRTKKKEHSDTHAHFESDFEAAVERGRPLTRTPRRTPINQTRYTKLGKKKKTTTSASFGLFPRLDCADRDKREREIEREREWMEGRADWCARKRRAVRSKRCRRRRRDPRRIRPRRRRWPPGTAGTRRRGRSCWTRPR